MQRKTGGLLAFFRSFVRADDRTESLVPEPSLRGASAPHLGDGPIKRRVQLRRAAGAQA